SEAGSTTGSTTAPSRSRSTPSASCICSLTPPRHSLGSGSSGRGGSTPCVFRGASRCHLEVAGEIAVDHLGMPAPDQPLDLPHGVEGPPPRAVPVLLRLQVGLEDRLQAQHRRHLRYAVYDARDAQRPLLAIRFGDVHTPDRLGTVRPLLEVVRQFVQPPV